MLASTARMKGILPCAARASFPLEPRPAGPEQEKSAGSTDGQKLVHGGDNSGASLQVLESSGWGECSRHAEFCHNACRIHVAVCKTIGAMCKRKYLRVTATASFSAKFIDSNWRLTSTFIQETDTEITEASRVNYTSLE